jgi:hypothetical protein
MLGAPQLVNSGQIDYLVFDYLAETTMSLLAAARARKPEMGYATDFVDVAMKLVLPDVMRRGIKVVANAGGINPHGCAQALRVLADSMGLSPTIAIVEGDDVAPRMPMLRSADTRDMFTHEPLPEKILSANAYLGALPVARALAAGADIVITGRGVDSAVTLGPLMHEFGWAPDDHDRLAQGSLAGHIIECGCQATGGLHTDWEAVPDWPHIGYPVIECHSDGHFTVTKPPGTGGLVNTAVISEQMLYEIGDPAAYLLPDVVCDFTGVTLTQDGENRVRVQGATGRAPGAFYKVSSTFMDGFRCTAQLMIVGVDAARKAQRTGEAILTRTREMFRELGLADFSRSQIEVLGSELANFGPHAHTRHVREAVLHLGVMHPQKPALELFAREIAPAGTSWSPGTTGASGRPSPSPCIKQFAFLVAKSRLAPSVTLDGRTWSVDIPAPSEPDGTHPAAAATSSSSRLPTAPSGTEVPASGIIPAEAHQGSRTVPLIALAYARSGDKGDTSNIGIIARRPEWLALLQAQVTEEAVADHLAHLVRGKVLRYALPGIHAMNFVCTEALDGGGMASLRNDPLGKGMGQVLLTLPVRVPDSMVL